MNLTKSYFIVYTFGIHADGIGAGGPRLERVEADITGNFKKLGVLLSEEFKSSWGSQRAENARFSALFIFSGTSGLNSERVTMPTE